VELEICSRFINHEIPQHLNRRIIHGAPDDVWNTDVLHDLDLMPDCAGDAEQNTKNEDSYEYLGWRVIVWTRTLSSTYWRKERVLHVNDIHGNNPNNTSFLDDLGGRRTLTLTLKDLFTSTPTLSTDDRNSLYLIYKVKQGDDELLVIMIDMEKKTVEEFSPILTQRPYLASPTYIPCALSKYLNMDTGNHRVSFSCMYFALYRSSVSVVEADMLLCWGFGVFALVLSTNGDFAHLFCFVRFCPRVLKMKLQFAPIPLEGVNGIKYVEKKTDMPFF
jgi:hypothetical protein